MLTTEDRAILKRSQAQFEQAASHATEAKRALALVLQANGNRGRENPALRALLDDTCATIRRCRVLAGRIGSLLREEPR